MTRPIKRLNDKRISGMVYEDSAAKISSATAEPVLEFYRINWYPLGIGEYIVHRNLVQRNRRRTWLIPTSSCWQSSDPVSTWMGPNIDWVILAIQLWPWYFCGGLDCNSQVVQEAVRRSSFGQRKHNVELWSYSLMSSYYEPESESRDPGSYRSSSPNNEKMSVEALSIMTFIPDSPCCTMSIFGWQWHDYRSSV